MSKYYLYLLCAFGALFVGCAKKQQIAQEESPNFEKLMGKELPAWQHVKTKEDFENLHFFKTLFEQNIPLLKAEYKKYKIPQVIHFIWVGPKPFPRESVENIKSWIIHNPDWKVKFWTDRERPLPHPAMEQRLIKDFTFLKLAQCYHKSDNYGEKSDLLRLEILYQEGGIYADHDVKCLHSFDTCSEAYDLFCGLEMPYQTSLPSSVLPTNNLLGAKAGHPVLLHAMDWLVEKWDQIERDYPGKDRDAVINRVSHRTFSILGETLKKIGNQEGNKDMVFPAFYFNSPDENNAIMARHQYAGTWFENESQFEKMVRERLMMLSKKTNKMLLFFGILTSLNVLGFILLFFRMSRLNKSNVL